MKNKMNGMVWWKTGITLVVFSAVCINAGAQTDWHLKKDEDGIKVFTGTDDSSSDRKAHV